MTGAQEQNGEATASIVDLVTPVLDRCSAVAERLARLVLRLLPS
ncbi:MAG TPA: hypothetical protein VFV67_03605 [Actinophytocola sp.]|nr:hypothetical protein [Actinophytocola sp.]HEU5469714.1 hypothetical protein [Actinophytocola sp.]